MAQLIVKYDPRGVRIFERAAAILSGPQLRQLSREALSAGGNKTNTQMKRALKGQMGTKRQQPINAGVRAFLQGDLAFTIVGTGKGLDIEEFPLRKSKSLRAMVRWDPRKHWMWQAAPFGKRQAGGYWGKIPKKAIQGAVAAAPWAKMRTFQRSFVGPSGPRAMLPDEKRARKLFGAGVGKEIVLDQSLAEFNAGAKLIERSLIAKLSRFVP